MAECCRYGVRPKLEHGLSDSETEREIERKGIFVACMYVCMWETHQEARPEFIRPSAS
jgi:hypothetical protein